MLCLFLSAVAGTRDHFFVAVGALKSCEIRERAEGYRREELELEKNSVEIPLGHVIFLSIVLVRSLYFGSCDR